MYKHCYKSSHGDQVYSASALIIYCLSSSKKKKISRNKPPFGGKSIKMPAIVYISL